MRACRQIGVHLHLPAATARIHTGRARQRHTRAIRACATRPSRVRPGRCAPTCTPFQDLARRCRVRCGRHDDQVDAPGPRPVERARWRRFQVNREFGAHALAKRFLRWANALGMRLFKGASAGSHWYVQDPRTNSGFVSSPGTKDVAALVNHITNYSHPSPYLSFTASPAIAREYALPVGGSRGRIYEIETAMLSPVELYDPLFEITTAYGKLAKFKGPVWATHHEGGAGLLSAIAEGRSSGAPVPHRRNAQRAPQVSQHLQAVVFALRDAEVLLAGNLPSTCIVDAWDVP